MQFEDLGEDYNWGLEGVTIKDGFTTIQMYAFFKGSKFKFFKDAVVSLKPILLSIFYICFGYYILGYMNFAINFIALLYFFISLKSDLENHRFLKSQEILNKCKCEEIEIKDAIAEKDPFVIEAFERVKRDYGDDFEKVMEMINSSEKV